MDIRRLKKAALATLAVVSAVAPFATPGERAAAAGCYGSSCTGRDPVAMGCGHIYTMDHVTSGVLTVNLRYSPDCNAVWAQVVGPWGMPNYGGMVEGSVSTSDAGIRVTELATPPQPAGTYSLMVSFSYWTRVCIAYNAWGWGTQGCTGWH